MAPGRRRVMPYLWFEQAKGAGADGWAVLPLEKDCSLVRRGIGTALIPMPLAGGDGGHDAAVTARVLRVTIGAAREAWALTGAPGSFLVNGVAIHTGVRVLQDRDEVRLGRSLAAYFSAESRACIEAYPRDDEPTCPRCRLHIVRGETAVRCPNSDCRVWHHQGAGDGQSGSRHCWTYHTRCAVCSQPTDLDGSFAWTPATP